MEKLESSRPSELSARSISDNIPGGMFSCRFDEFLTLLQMNDGFLSMLDYTRSDIHLLFHDSFLSLIDPRDRAPSMEEARRQLALGPEKELEYRMTRRDGSIIWVLDKGRLIHEADGSAYFYCVLVDVTHRKELESKLRLSLERHQIIMDQTTNILFEWNLIADTFEFSSNWEKKFGNVPVTQNVSLYIADAPHVFPDDRPIFSSLLSCVKRGKHYMEGELRFLTAANDPLWCRMRLTGQSDESGRTVRAVGVIIDVDAEKRQSQRLLEYAQQDTLTKLYNKGTSAALIEAALSAVSPSTQAAMMIIDLDNFKQINDSMGHLFGDALLVEAAHTLRRQFRNDDIVGRIGGDEFIVFLRQIPGRAAVEAKASQLLRAMCEMATREQTNVTLSCSIGIALFPACGTTYHVLFQKADQALYQAKRQGKNRFCLFEPDAIPWRFPPSPLSAVSAPIDSDKVQLCAPMGPSLVEHILRLLYRSVDLDTAVNAILEIVGCHFDVSRAYIFENTEDNGHCCNTFEWCSKGIVPEIENLRFISYTEQLDGKYTDNFNEDGVFYCRDIRVLPSHQYAILAPQGIKSMLQCGIYDNGVFRGYVGFDECRINRFWTQGQVDALTLISEILSIFLLKQRAQERAIQNAQAMERILDSQNAWIYVVRPQTYEMLYINRKTRELVPTARLGMKCHQAYFQRDTPCPFCPVTGLDEAHASCTREIYNPVLKLWTSTDTSHLNWKGEKAVLLTCHDITPLKHALEALQPQD